MKRLTDGEIEEENWDAVDDSYTVVGLANIALYPYGLEFEEGVNKQERHFIRLRESLHGKNIYISIGTSEDVPVYMGTVKANSLEEAVKKCYRNDTGKLPTMYIPCHADNIKDEIPKGSTEEEKQEIVWQAFKKYFGIDCDGSGSDEFIILEILPDGTVTEY